MEQTNRTDTAHTAYAVLLAISFAHLLNDMMQSVIPSIYPLIKDKYGFSFGQIGLITLVFQMMSSILQPIVGRYADRHPRPYSLSVGMMFTFAGMLLISVAFNFGLILVAVSIIGWGSSVFHPEASRIAQLAAGGKKGLAQSIFQVGGNGGSAIGPLLAAAIVLPYGQGAIGWFAIAALVACVTLFGVGRWYSRQLHRTVSRTIAVSREVMALTTRQVNRAMAILIFLIFSKYFYMACMTSYFAFLAAVAVGTILGGHLGDRYGRKYVIWISIFGAAPFALILPYVSLPLTIVLAVIIGLVIASAFSAILVYATELKPGKVGMIAGLFFGLMFGLGGIGSAFFGWLADRTSIELVFRVSAFLPLLGAVAGFLPNIDPSKRS